MIQMKSYLRSLVIVLMVCLVALLCGPVHAGPIRNLLGRLGNRCPARHAAASTQSQAAQATVQTRARATTRIHAHQGQCQVINGVRVCQ